MLTVTIGSLLNSEQIHWLVFHFMSPWLLAANRMETLTFDLLTLMHPFIGILRGT